jgi:transposase-like protein
MQLMCPSCNCTLVKKNGHISNGKQNHQCLVCKRQFVENSTQKLIDDTTRNLVRKALLERVSLLGICRIFDISMPWLLDFLQNIFEELPEDLNVKINSCEASDVEIVELEADELWSFVGSKK